MKLYEIKDENSTLELQVVADADGLKKIEKHFNKSIEEINKELSQNKYFTCNNKKYYLSVMFLDFIEENEEKF